MVDGRAASGDSLRPLAACRVSRKRTFLCAHATVHSGILGTCYEPRGLPLGSESEKESPLLASLRLLNPFPPSARLAAQGP